MDSLVVECIPYEDRDRVFSLNYLGYNLGFVVGPVIGGLLFQNYLSLAFIIDGLTTFTSTILIIIFVSKIDIVEPVSKNEYEDGEDKTSIFSVFLKRKTLIVFVTLSVLSGFIYNQWGFLLPIYMSDLFLENGAKYYGYVAAANGLVVIILTPILTKVLYNKFELTKKRIAYLMYFLSFLTIAFFTKLPFFFIMVMLLTIGEILETLCNSPYLMKRVPSSHRGRIVSFVSIAYTLGASVGGVLVGILIDNTSMTFTLICVALLSLFCFLITSILFTFDKNKFPKLYNKVDN